MDSKFVLLGQLIPCVAHHTDTCLKSIALLLNNDKTNVSISLYTITEIIYKTPHNRTVKKEADQVGNKSVFSRP